MDNQFIRYITKAHHCFVKSKFIFEDNFSSAYNKTHSTRKKEKNDISLLQHIVKYALKTQKYNACKNNCNNDILNNSIFPR